MKKITIKLFVVVIVGYGLLQPELDLVGEEQNNAEKSYHFKEIVPLGLYRISHILPVILGWLFCPLYFDLFPEYLELAALANLLGHPYAGVVFKGDEYATDIRFILISLLNFDDMLELKDLRVVRFFNSRSSSFEKLKHLMVVKYQVHPGYLDPVIFVEHSQLVPNPSPHLLAPGRVTHG